MPLFSKNHHTTTTGTHGAGHYDQYGTGTTGTHHGVGTGPTHHGAGTTGTHHYGTEDAYEGMGGHTAPHGSEYAAEPYGNNSDREGRTLKELGEADRMEEEANIRRQRALAHGTAPGAGRTDTVFLERLSTCTVTPLLSLETKYTVWQGSPALSYFLHSLQDVDIQTSMYIDGRLSVFGHVQSISGLLPIATLAPFTKTGNPDSEQGQYFIWIGIFIITEL
ncbi:uncharacterized protein SCHCODRAFT_02513759 [Schizophyllum commune H4-8]|uniref:Uncharacterized protein n=1 Tax=Schizophyllum commune (strain H4-8 / FGSC 9210) TaxID=578458 RepID=D8QEC2_SCHCM|nr:uncharacterized protein SCHCODRAFT_02513759 [Schizophyllum commune H4-8]KAI5888358.1 hypothetical protein SCHCODRAFT_02513759 [Schizophyllum commune H4-8]